MGASRNCTTSATRSGSRIHKRIGFYQERIEAATKAKVGVDRGYEHWKKKQVKAIERLRAEEKAVVASIRERVSALREQRATARRLDRSAAAATVPGGRSRRGLGRLR